MIMRIKKKPVVVCGIRFTGTLESAKEICAWCNAGLPKMDDPIADYTYGGGGPVDLQVWTKEGVMEVVRNAVVIKGVEGEFYPCKPSVFKKTYDILPDTKEKI